MIYFIYPNLMTNNNSFLWINSCLISSYFRWVQSGSYLGSLKNVFYIAEHIQGQATLIQSPFLLLGVSYAGV